MGAITCSTVGLTLYTDTSCSTPSTYMVGTNGKCALESSMLAFDAVQLAATSTGGGCDETTSPTPMGTEMPTGQKTLCCL
jgi:hypothetical protein